MPFQKAFLPFSHNEQIDLLLDLSQEHFQVNAQIQGKCICSGSVYRAEFLSRRYLIVVNGSLWPAYVM